MAADTPPVPQENAEEIIDLTELIERGDAASTPDIAAHIQSLNAQPKGEDAEIEALLAQMDAGDGAAVSPGPAAPLGEPPAAAAPRAVDPHEQLDMSDMGDIDDLLASLDIPPQPRDSAPGAPEEAPQDAPEAAAEAPVAAPANMDIPQSLDQAMDELLSGSAPQAPRAAPAPSPEAAPATPAGPSVEELLAAAAAPATPTAPAAPEPDLDADLDALLNETASSAPPVAEVTPGAPDLDADLDSLLTSLNAETQAPAEPAPEAPAAMEQEAPPPAEPAEPAAPAAMEQEAPAPAASPAPEMFPDDPPQAAPAPSEAPVAEEAAPEAAAMPPLAETAPEPAAMEEPAQPVAAAADGERDMAPAPEVAAGPVPEDAQASTDAPAQATATPGEAEDFAALAETLGERLRQCEADLAAARARIEALEHSSAESVSLGDLLREGSPLHNGFAALIASSVGQALKDTPPPVCLPANMEERINTLETREKSLTARMDALEGRLDSLEPRFNEEVGKAAAGAVARILREEISRLAGG